MAEIYRETDQTSSRGTMTVSNTRYWIANPNWVSDAVCRDEPTERFYPKTRIGAAGAIRICANCVVRTDCLAYALEHRIESGVWGGRTAAQRHHMLRRAQLGRGSSSTPNIRLRRRWFGLREHARARQARRNELRRVRNSLFEVGEP